MLRYVYIGMIDGYEVYEFYPEGDRRYPGRIGFGPEEERKIFQESEMDQIGWYKGHAFSGIDRNMAYGTVAWY